METITMSNKETRYGEIIPQIITGTLSQSEAALFLGRSIRQIKRLCKKYRAKGLKGLIHESRGKDSNNKINEDLKDKILNLINASYADFSCQLISEQLRERHKITVSAEWIRKTLISTGTRKVRKRSA